MMFWDNRMSTCLLFLTHLKIQLVKEFINIIISHGRYNSKEDAVKTKIVVLDNLLYNN